MSFAKIAEARAVKKILALIRGAINERYAAGSEYDPYEEGAHNALEEITANIEAGRWKELKLPKPKQKKKRKK